MTSTQPEEGIPFSLAVQLLEKLRHEVIRSQEKADPNEFLWDMLLKYGIEHQPSNLGASSFSTWVTFVSDQEEVESSSDGSMIPVVTYKEHTSNPDEESITAAAFLRFLHKEQGEKQATIVRVRDLFERLNSQTRIDQLSDDFQSRIPTDELPSCDKITKEAFLEYLYSDSNDLFVSRKGITSNVFIITFINVSHLL
jgi:hypothetical protein